MDEYVWQLLHVGSVRYNRDDARKAGAQPLTLAASHLLGLISRLSEKMRGQGPPHLSAVAGLWRRV